MNFTNMNQSRTPDLLNLKKNEMLNLTKVAPSLKNVILGAGWDVASRGPSMDLDIAAFLLDANDRVANIGTDVIYFNNMTSTGIKLEGDNRTGEGEGDDERIDINLDLIPSNIHRIVFFVTIYEADSKKQTFGMVNNSYVRLLDADNNEKEILRYELKENCSGDTALTFAELIRENNGWTFHAIGEGSVGDLNALLYKYM
jgi:tellurium resistance protein TerD